VNGATLRVGMRRVEIERKFDETCAEPRRSIVAFAEPVLSAAEGSSGFLDTPVKRYSSRMYVRLAFAVAAHFFSS